MPFLLLMLLVLTCRVEPGQWPEPHFLNPSADEFFHTLPSPVKDQLACASTVLAWTTMSAAGLFAGFISCWVSRALRRHPERRERILSRYGTLRFAHLLCLFAAYGVVLYGLGWGWAVHWLCLYDQVVLPGAELILLAPFLAALVFSWYCFYDAERSIRETSHPYFISARPVWSRGAYVLHHARQNLALVLVPIFLLVILQGLHRHYRDLYETAAFQVLSFGLLILMFLCLPWTLRLVLGLRPMPAGELRDRLEAAGRRLNFRCTDILLWDTRLGVANAMVVGLLPWPRYVVFTDRLLLDLSADEVEAVFGHEVGHVKHHHMAYYLAFLFVSLGVLVGAFELLAQQNTWLKGMLNIESSWSTPLLVGSLVVYIFVFFGFLSRRCERQADIFGCKSVSCGQPVCAGHDEESKAKCGQGLCPTGIQTFIQALEKVACLNGISRNKPSWLQSWQHSTIGRRIEFLQQIGRASCRERV